LCYDSDNLSKYTDLGSCINSNVAQIKAGLKSNPSKIADKSIAAIIKNLKEDLTFANMAFSGFKNCSAFASNTYMLPEFKQCIRCSYSDCRRIDKRLNQKIMSLLLPYIQDQLKINVYTTFHIKRNRLFG